MNTYSTEIGIYMLDRMWNECLISMEDFEVMFIILNAMHDDIHGVDVFDMNEEMSIDRLM